MAKVLVIAQTSSASRAGFSSRWKATDEHNGQAKRGSSLRDPAHKKRAREKAGSLRSE